MSVRSTELCGLPSCAEVLVPHCAPNELPIHLRMVNIKESPEYWLHAAQQDDPEFHRHQYWPQYVTTIKSAQTYVARYHASILEGSGLIYDMFEGFPDDPGGHLGLAGLMKNVTVGPPVADAGYWAIKRARGQGYMKRAMRAVIDYAAEYYGPDLTVNFYIAQGNLASEHIAMAMGAKIEGATVVDDPQGTQRLQTNKWTIKP